ncbi:hypothetical protein [Xanthobacter sp. KR7-225]|uniref:hypothetical protein n=1 Tax=Xanthobacter sp. KR7-225 TaxID=3156613 RepID=UPI0032B402AE
MALNTGADANFDLRNYHLYNAFSFSNSRLDIDFLPVGIHSYINPLIDLPFYIVYQTYGVFAAHILLIFYFSVFIFITFLFNMRVFDAIKQQYAPYYLFSFNFLPVCATLISISGAAAIGQAITTMNEIQTATLVTSSLLFILPTNDPHRQRLLALMLGGYLLGFAVGLKLTAMIYAIGAVFTLFPWRGTLAGIWRWMAFCLGLGIGAVSSGGYWSWTIYKKFGNPIYPFYDGVFKSPLGDGVNGGDLRFIPTTMLDYLIYPLHWAFQSGTQASELAVRDPRLLLLLISSIVLISVHFFIRPIARTLLFLIVFGIASYVVWLLRFSILRYAVVLEVISGTLIVSSIAIIAFLLGLRRSILYFLSGLLAFVLISFTDRPNWGRVPFPDAYSLSMEPVPDGSIVLLVGRPVAFLAALIPGRDIKYVGIDEWTTQPGPRLKVISEMLSRNDHKLFALFRLGDDQIAAIGSLGLTLESRECSPVHIAIDPGGLVFCPIR